MMNPIVNRRKCMDSVRILCTAGIPTQEMVVLAIKSLAQVITDLSGEEVRLQIELLSDAAPHNQQQGE